MNVIMEIKQIYTMDNLFCLKYFDIYIFYHLLFIIYYLYKLI